MEGVGGARVDGIESQDGADDDERIRPGVAEGEVFPSAEVGAGFSPFGVESCGFAVGWALEGEEEEAESAESGGKGQEGEGKDCTGVKGGDAKVGVGSRVERAEAVLSPLSSAPSPLDFRRGRGMMGRRVCWSWAVLMLGRREVVEWREERQ